MIVSFELDGVFIFTTEELKMML